MSFQTLTSSILPSKGAPPLSRAPMVNCELPLKILVFKLPTEPILEPSTKNSAVPAELS